MIYISGDHEVDGALSPGLYLNNLSDVTVKDCTIIGNTYPRGLLDWITQHPGLRQRERVARLRSSRKYR